MTNKKIATRYIDKMLRLLYIYNTFMKGDTATMKRTEKEELEHYRAQRKKEFDYRNKYSKENYRRMICMYPVAHTEAVDEAMKQAEAKSVSAYLCMLVDRDLKERGLIK